MMEGEKNWGFKPKGKSASILRTSGWGRREGKMWLRWLVLVGQTKVTGFAPEPWKKEIQRETSVTIPDRGCEGKYVN